MTSAGPFVRNSPADIYLETRGIELSGDEGSSLRFAPALWHWPTQSRWPAMLARVSLATGAEIATHHTFVEPDGSGKAPLGKQARLFAAGGRILGGGVWFGEAESNREFIVAEGIESTLSAMRRCVWPLREPQSLRRIRRAGWACGISSDGVPRRTQGAFPVDGPAHIIPVGALILAGSRGGIICFAFEVAVLALLARTRKGLRGATLIAIAFVGLASIALIAWLGVGRAIERFSKTRIVKYRRLGVPRCFAARSTFSWIIP